MTLPLSSNARAKMQGLPGLREAVLPPGDRRGDRRCGRGAEASELILPVAMAVQNRLTVPGLAHTFAVYPSLSGSVTEAARQLMRHNDLD